MKSINMRNMTGLGDTLGRNPPLVSPSKGRHNRKGHTHTHIHREKKLDNTFGDNIVNLIIIQSSGTSTKAILLPLTLPHSIE